MTEPGDAAGVTIEAWGDRPDAALVDWRNTVPGKNPNGDRTDIDFDAFLDETHHRQYGRPWSIGRSYADYLIEIGLRPADTLLDFGCGAGRAGIWLIGCLDAGRYFGVDSHLRSLEAFAHYEIPLHRLAAKRPRLAHDAAFGFAAFGVAFDWVVDFFASAHMPAELADQLYRRFADSTAPGGRLVMAAPPPVAPGGFVLERVDQRPAFLLDRSRRQVATFDFFHVYRRA